MTITPNIGIFKPAPGQDLYGNSFAVGLDNIDEHDHSGAPNKGKQIGGGGITNFSIGFLQLNSNVADPTTGIGTSLVTPNQLILLGVLPSIFNLAGNGILVKDSTNAFTVTMTGTANEVAVANGAGTAGANPTFSLAPIVTKTTQPAFSAGVGAAQNGVTGNGGAYTVLFPDISTVSPVIYNQGGGYASPTYTTPAAGIYIFSTALTIDNITGDNVTDVEIVVGGVPLTIYSCNTRVIRDVATRRVYMSGSVQVKVAAAVAVSVRIRVSDMGVNDINITEGFFQGIKVW